MGLRLHHNPASPFARKAYVTVIESRRRAEVELVHATTNALGTGESPVPGNPLGKIPVLERDDGPAIFDSTVICRFLAEGGRSTLYPSGPALWEALTLEALGDGISEAAVSITYESRFRPEELRHGPWVEGQWQKIARALDVLENRWMAHLYGPLDIGQVSVGCALGYLDLRHGARNWRQGRAALAAWFEKLLTRESFAETVPPG